MIPRSGRRPARPENRLGPDPIIMPGPPASPSTCHRRTRPCLCRDRPRRLPSRSFWSRWPELVRAERSQSSGGGSMRSSRSVVTASRRAAPVPGSRRLAGLPWPSGRRFAGVWLRWCLRSSCCWPIRPPRPATTMSNAYLASGRRFSSDDLIKVKSCARPPADRLPDRRSAPGLRGRRPVRSGRGRSPSSRSRPEPDPRPDGQARASGTLPRSSPPRPRPRTSRSWKDSQDARACRPVADLVQGTRAQLELGDRPRPRFELVGGHGDPCDRHSLVDPQAVERNDDLDQVVPGEPTAGGEDRPFDIVVRGEAAR